MPQVPYTGVPQVAPQDTPIPRYQADAGPAAFGVNIAQATQHLGEVAQGAGSELFARGLAMQDLYNHSEAQQADADYMQKSGELHAQYSSLEGKAAVDAYPKYIQDLQDARTGIRDNLSNGMSQKLFDGSSLSTMGRTIFNGAGHAATQNKQYALGASKARVAAMGDQALSTPADSDAFQDSLADTEDEVRAQGLLQGADPDSINQAVAQEKSKLWGNRITGLAKQQPFTAGKLLDQAIKDGEVRGEDIGKLTNLVQAARNNVGARQVSQQVMTGAGNRYGEGQVDIKQAGRAIAQIESGGNYDTQTDTGSKHGIALGKYQVMSGYLPEFLREAGMPPMSANDFIKDHAAQEELFANRFGALMKETGSANGAAARWIGTKGKDAFGTDANTYVSRFNAALAHNAPLADKVAVGQRIADESAPTDPLFGDYVTQRIESDSNRQQAIKRDDQFQQRSVIETALMGDQHGNIPTTIDELIHDPKAADAWQRLGEENPATQRRYMGVLASNAKGDHNWTDETLRQYESFKGMAQTNPADFVDEDIVSTSLPTAARKELLNLQLKLKDQATGDPRVTRALGILAPDMQAAGISKADKDNYYQFVGSLSDQLKDFAEDNKRPPKMDEIRKIGAQLMQGQVQKGWLWNSQSPMYQLPVPSEIVTSAKALNPALTDAMIQREYTRQKYQELYGKPSKLQTAAAPVSQ